jgi:hypothetical protein
MPTTKLLLITMAVALNIALVADSQADPCSLSGLSWMAGTWRNTGDPQGAQERWAIAPQNVLMGTSWDFPNGKSGYAEIMTIKEDGENISLVLRHFDGGLKRAWEEREAPMVFNVASCARNSVVFDGQGDHSGEHLTYRRTGRNLLIVGDFIHRGTPDHEERHMIRTGD